MYRHLAATSSDLAAGRIVVKNWFDVTNARDLAEMRWTVTEEEDEFLTDRLPPFGR